MNKAPSVIMLILFGAFIICAGMCNKFMHQRNQAINDKKQLKIDTAIMRGQIKNFNPIEVTPCPVHCSWEETHNE